MHFFRLQHIAARIGAAPMIIIIMGQREPFHNGHLGTAVGHDHQDVFAVFERFLYKRHKRLTGAIGKVPFPFASGATAFTIAAHPGKVFGIVLHIDVIAAFENTETHFAKIRHHHLLTVGKDYVRRLPSAAQGGYINFFRSDVGYR